MKPRNPPLQSFRLLDQVRERIRYLHYSLSTEKTYLYWVRFYVRWHGRNGTMTHPRRSLGVRSFIHVFRSSFAHSELPDWQHKISIKSGSRATNTCVSSYYFNSKSLPACRLCIGRNDAALVFLLKVARPDLFPSFCCHLTVNSN